MKLSNRLTLILTSLLLTVFLSFCVQKTSKKRNYSDREGASNNTPYINNSDRPEDPNKSNTDADPSAQGPKYENRSNQTSRNENDTGFYIWEESTDIAVFKKAIEMGIKSFRSRDLTALMTQKSVWSLFKQHEYALDVLAGVPIRYKAWTKTPINLNELANLVNENKFLRRLQIDADIYTPGNYTENQPCKAWKPGADATMITRLKQLDQLITDKSVEFIIPGLLDQNTCQAQSNVMNAAYELQSNGRAMGWGVTAYPFYWGQTPDAQVLKSGIDKMVNILASRAPSEARVIPLRVLESGWPTACHEKSDKANLQNHCIFAKNVVDFPKNRNSTSTTKFYFFSLQDYQHGWNLCEKNFGLFDLEGNIKCSNCSNCARPF